MPARVRRTLADMLRNGFQSFAYCSACRAYKQVDLAALMEKMGPDYSLWNRRCRCRKPGCIGWVRFKVGPGWHTSDFDEQTESRWGEAEFEEQMQREPALRASVEKYRASQARRDGRR